MGADNCPPVRVDLHSARHSAETHRVIAGRRWRVSDPALDPSTRQHLVNELMEARRAVRSAIAADDANALAGARGRVGDAKVALGERGPKWWEPMNRADVGARAEALVRAIGDRTGSVVELDDAVSILHLDR